MKTSVKILLAVSGLLMVALGVYCLCRPVETLFASAWLIGLLTLLSGIAIMIFTFKTQGFLPNSGSRMLSSLLLIILGILFLTHKGAVTASLPFVFAFWVIVEGISLAIEAFDYKEVGFNGWWCILLLGIAAAILGFFGVRNPALTGKTLSTLIGIGIILSGVSYLVALAGIGRFERKVKEIKAELFQ